MSADNPFHATSLIIDGRALLIVGRSGSGKSDLALRLIDRGALLLSDDYTRLERRGAALVAMPPSTIAGKIEVRGVGIFEKAFASEGRVALLLDLDAEAERLPEAPIATRRLEQIDIPVLAFSPFGASAAIKAELALIRHGLGGAS